MNDQKQHWNDLHRKGGVDYSSSQPSVFAKDVAALFSSPIKILELGCGVGNDSMFFAKKGHLVIATDFSDEAISSNQEKTKNLSNLTFEQLDISRSYPYQDNEFDLVYARLSLHYFDDQITKSIFKRIHKTLKSGGLLCFLCKSKKDPLYGKGKQIEKDMFEYNGHIRHFFSQEYIKECLEGMFKIQKVETGKDSFYNSPSAFIKVIVVNINKLQ